MRPNDLIDIINGERYFTVKAFAMATNRSEQNVRFLMAYGNKVRKLKVVYVLDKPMIPYDELLNFPFTLPGRFEHSVYHYNADGQIIEDAHVQV